MRVLAIDFGTKRIGTAVSDALGISVRPVETIKRSSNERDIARLKTLVEELEAEAVVVGLPLRMDGAEGDAALQVKRFLLFAVGLESRIPRRAAHEFRGTNHGRARTQPQRAPRHPTLAAMTNARLPIDSQDKTDPESPDPAAV